MEPMKPLGKNLTLVPCLQSSQEHYQVSKVTSWQKKKLKSIGIEGESDNMCLAWLLALKGCSG